MKPNITCLVEKFSYTTISLGLSSESDKAGGRNTYSLTDEMLHTYRHTGYCSPPQVVIKIYYYQVKGVKEWYNS